MENRMIYVRILYQITRRMNVAMGHLAIEIAKHQGDIEFSWSDDIVDIKTEGRFILTRLMLAYKQVLGALAYKVAMDSIEQILIEYPEVEVPEELLSKNVKMARYNILKEKLDEMEKKMGKG